MMIELFSNAKRPFYSSTQYLVLDKIEFNAYKAFIIRKFTEKEILIEDEAVNYVLSWTKQHTFYTQSLCNMIFSMDENIVNIQLVKQACNELLNRNEAVFFQFRQLLTSGQWNFLIAVAKEGEVTQLTAQKFIANYEIGTPANARRISRSLIDKELILETINKKGSYYQVYDVFLSRWLESEY